MIERNATEALTKTIHLQINMPNYRSVATQNKDELVIYKHTFEFIISLRMCGKIFCYEIFIARCLFSNSVNMHIQCSVSIPSQHDISFFTPRMRHIKLLCMYAAGRF